jgi:predicted nuclease with TOPRIM domain
MQFEETNARLTGENERLVGDNTRLTGEYSRLTDDNALLRDDVMRLRDENRELNEAAAARNVPVNTPDNNDGDGSHSYSQFVCPGRAFRC